MAQQTTFQDVFAERYGNDLTRRPVLMGVHPSDIGFILGKNGSTVKKIEKTVGATITLVPYTMTYPNVPPHFTIVGNQQATMTAFSQLSALASESLRRQWMKSAKTSEVTNTLKIKRDDMKMVIGRGGHTIQTINKRYNVRSFTRADDKDPKDTSVIDITGYGPDVAAAKKHIWNIVNESMRRRGISIDMMEQSDEMFHILKKDEDSQMIRRMMHLYETYSMDEFWRLHTMLQQSDPVLLKRVEEACKLKTKEESKEESKEETNQERKTVRFSDEEE